MHHFLENDSDFEHIKILCFTLRHNTKLIVSLWDILWWIFTLVKMQNLAESDHFRLFWGWNNQISPLNNQNSQFTPCFGSHRTKYYWCFEYGLIFHLGCDRYGHFEAKKSLFSFTHTNKVSIWIESKISIIYNNVKKWSDITQVFNSGLCLSYTQYCFSESSVRHREVALWTWQMLR